MHRISILSGGQTGADRAALDFAIDHGIPHGGWCPKGRRAEDGSIPLCYQLRDTLTEAYKYRTEANVRDSDGTVVFTIRPKLSGGSLKTVLFAQNHGKPYVHLFRDSPARDPRKEPRRFIKQNNIKILNVAGSRSSKEPGVSAFVKQVLERAL